jgi:hypothetical protein
LFFSPEFLRGFLNRFDMSEVGITAASVASQGFFDLIRSWVEVMFQQGFSCHYEAWYTVTAELLFMIFTI